MKLTNIVFCLMLLGGGLTSCIREDLDDCFSTNKLVLSYKGDGDKEIFPDKICRVEMYVFNAENQCVNSSVLPEDQVKSRTALLPPLEAGEYRIICLGNTHHTKVDRLDAGDYRQMLFAAEDYLAGNTVSGNDSLYYASTPYTVQKFTGREEDQVKVIEFASSHYDLLVEVAGVPEMETAQAPCLRSKSAVSRPLPILRTAYQAKPPTIYLKPTTKPACCRPVPT